MFQNKRIENCIKALVENMSQKDLSVFWPLPLPSVDPCYVDLFANEVIRLMGELNRRSISNQEISSALKYPSRLFNVIFFTITGAKMAKWSIEKRLKLLDQIFNIVSFLKVGDMFNLDGKNIILSQDKIDQLIKNTQWNFIRTYQKPQSISKAVAKLNGLLWAYADSLYSIYHKDGLEKHGQYNVILDDKHYGLVIRNGYNLKPVNLWKDVSEVANFPYNFVNTFVIYKDTEIKFDIFDNIIHKDNLVEKTLAFYVEAGNGKEIRIIRTEEKIEKLGQILAKNVKVLTSEIESWNIKTRAKKFIEISWHTFEPLYNLLNENWKERIPQEAIKRIEGGCLHYPPPPPPEEPRKFFRNLFDPRVE